MTTQIRHFYVCKRTFFLWFSLSLVNELVSAHTLSLVSLPVAVVNTLSIQNIKQTKIMRPKVRLLVCSIDSRVVKTKNSLLGLKILRIF